MKTDLNRISNLDEGCFIYSMWSGYQADDKTRSFLEYLTGRGMILREIHAGGHADHEALKRMVDLLRLKDRRAVNLERDLSTLS